MIIKINSEEVEAKERMTVLEVAQSANIYIPTLCSHSSLLPYGGCRLCIVEIEGMKGFPTACTTPIEAGMVVRTHTPAVQDLRRRILELILSEHPYTCLVCDHKGKCKEYQFSIRKVGVTTGCEFCPNNGQCELQEVVEHIGMSQVDFPVTYRSLPVEKDDPFYDRDYNLCILCGRCVRVCQDVRGNGTLAFTYRGPRALVGTAFGKSHLESGCAFCGACVDVCPTGALSEKINKWEGKAERSVNTICPYCGIGCTLKLEVKETRIIRSLPSSEAINKGQACVRGRFCITQMIHSPNRIKAPMLMKEGKLVEVSWDEALDTVVSNLSRYKENQFAFVVSPQCTNEDSYVFQEFTQKVMGSNNITVASDNKIQGNVECNFMGLSNIIGKVGYAEIFKAIDNGSIKALYLTHNVDSNILSKLDFLVVQSVFPIPGIEFANVVLPAASFAEVDGSFININGKSQSLHKVIEPLYNSRADWCILCELAKRLNATGFNFKNSQEIRDEINQFINVVATLAVAHNNKAGARPAPTPLEIKPSDGFYSYRGCSLVDEVKGLKEVVAQWSKNV